MDQIVGGLNPMEYRRSLGLFNSGSRLRPHPRNETRNFYIPRLYALEILRYPFKDNELWAFTFIKKGTIFLCVNAGLPICKQVFAMAHELYHIHCYSEDNNTMQV